MSPSRIEFQRKARFGSNRSRLALAVLAALELTTTAIAQPSAKPVPAPSSTAIPTEPGTTTASFGDWVLRCQRIEGDKAKRICEVAQSMQMQGQSAPVAQVAIGRLAAGEPLMMTVLLPTSVSFPSSVRIFGDEKDSQGFDLPWRRCLPGACVADATVKDDALKRWQGLGEPGRIVFTDGSGREITIPLSFRGLAQALDALGREAP